MTLKSFTILAVFAAGLGIVSSAATAQGNISDVPANFPPESFTGRQFVDNKGCMYVRAGYDGAVTWVPRVTRSREHICGQTPTFGGTVAAQAPAAKPAPAPAAAAPAPQQIEIARPAPAPAPKPGVTAARPTGSIRVMTPSQPEIALTPAEPEPAARVAAPAPKPRAQATIQQRTTVRAPASKPVEAQPPRVLRRVPEATPAPQGAARMAPIPDYDNYCANGSMTKRTASGQTVTVRCGPQKAPHVTVIRRGEAPGPGKNVYYNKGWEGSALTPETRIVPRHVYEDQQVSKVAMVPDGYRPAWSDDRLNPYRAWQTVGGHAATQQVWTNTVPRELAYLARTHEIKDPVIAYRVTGSHAPMIATQGRTPVVSTRSESAGQARYVEIGAFTTAAKADAAAARLSGAGLPVRFGKVTQDGAVLRRVMVGPFAPGQALDKALSRTRAVGYTQAYLR